MQNKNYKIKKELISFNLLTQERVGLNKPNRLYLLKPNYDIKASHRTSKFTVPEQ